MEDGEGGSSEFPEPPLDLPLNMQAVKAQMSL